MKITAISSQRIENATRLHACCIVQWTPWTMLTIHRVTVCCPCLQCYLASEVCLAMCSLYALGFIPLVIQQPIALPRRPPASRSSSKTRVSIAGRRGAMFPKQYNIQLAWTVKCIELPAIRFLAAVLRLCPNLSNTDLSAHRWPASGHRKLKPIAWKCSLTVANLKVKPEASFLRKAMMLACVRSVGSTLPPQYFSLHRQGFAQCRRGRSRWMATPWRAGSS